MDRRLLVTICFFAISSTAAAEEKITSIPIRRVVLPPITEEMREEFRQTDALRRNRLDRNIDALLRYTDDSTQIDRQWEFDRMLRRGERTRVLATLRQRSYVVRTTSESSPTHRHRRALPQSAVEK